MKLIKMKDVELGGVDLPNGHKSGLVFRFVCQCCFDYCDLSFFDDALEWRHFCNDCYRLYDLERKKLLSNSSKKTLKFRDWYYKVIQDIRIKKDIINTKKIFVCPKCNGYGKGYIVNRYSPYARCDRCGEFGNTNKLNQLV